MSVVALSTIGTVLGGVMLFMLLPLIARAGSGAMAVASGLAAVLFCFFLGRLISRGVAGVIGADLEGGGPLWAGWMPLRGVDVMIYGFFVFMTFLLTVLMRGKKGQG